MFIFRWLTQSVDAVKHHRYHFIFHFQSNHGCVRFAHRLTHVTTHERDVVFLEFRAFRQLLLQLSNDGFESVTVRAVE
ncbi:Uncharacterised protein [Vibrio cholerae]|nr:Uncharacterised protein [Vibrio cholerae]